MHQPLKLQTHHNVTIFNKDMMLGALVGLIVPGFGPVALGAAAVGALIGGFVGKNRLEKENHEGKVVTTPTYLNKDTLIGGLLGSKIGVTVGLLALGTIIGALAGPGLLSAVGEAGGIEVVKAMAPEAVMKLVEPFIQPIIAAFGAGAATFLAATGAGAYFGAKAGYKQMEREFDMAQEQQRANQLTKVAQSIERSREPELAPEQSQNKSFLQTLDEERARAQQQSPTR